MFQPREGYFVLALSRQDALRQIEALVGKDLRPFADTHRITVFKAGRLNKGWAGTTLERCIGLSYSSVQGPDGKEWELKCVPLYRFGSGFKAKETMAITMINSADVVRNDFEHSHLYAKLKSMIVCGRLFEGRDELRSTLVRVGTFDLVDELTKKQVKEDYELVRSIIKNQGFSELSGRVGVLVQPRTKGPGHGSTSRAFYARKEFVSAILHL